MEPLKDDSIAGTSDKMSKIKEEALINNEYDFPEKVPTSCKDASEEERIFMVTFSEDGRKHVVKGRFTDSLLSALKSSKYVCDWMEKNEAKEFHLIEKKESLNVCVNLGMPLKYVSDHSQFEMKSYRVTKKENADEVWYRQFDDGKEECIVFFVHGLGSRMESHGAQTRKLMKNSRLLKEYCTFCIFAPKGESIKDALCNDGRFLPLLKETNWTLVEDGKIIDNHFYVNNLSDKVYDIAVESKKGARYCGDRNKKLKDLGGQQLSAFEKPQPRLDFEEGQLTASKKQQSHPDFEEGQLNTSKKQQRQDLERQILELYPKLKEEKQNILTILSGNKKDDLEVYKRDYGKEINDSLSFKLVRTLAKHGDSIGYIACKDVMGCFQPCGTCFVLRGRYILTCLHVINLIVGEGVEAKDWGDRIKQAAHVNFSYEEQHPTKGWFSLENWFEIADEALDFAVLKLEENESESHPPPPGLLRFNFSPPSNGPIFIIGHPNGGIKSMDVCLVVSIFDRGNEYENNLQHHRKSECSNYVCGYSLEKKCIHMYKPESFEKQRNNPDIVTYNTCFFEGSSGSPVFNKYGQLVALHASGFAYKRHNKDCSIIEWGYSVHSIILKIQSKFKSWHDSIIGPDAREDSSHVDAFLNEAEEEMDCN